MIPELRTPSGGRVDRARALNFSFDGRAYRGLAGDTLASALLANGVHLLGRSFKYHRPRGLLAAGAEEPSALVTVRRDAARSTPNLRATQLELYEGLEAWSQNRWPTLSFDLGAVNDLAAPFIPAGFYYKTFMWPRSAWQWLYEPRIRAAAGLGRAPAESDPDRYTGRFAHCDVLVVGAGPAGLAAAQAAAAAGARVVLCDEQCEPGGTLLSDPAGDEATLGGRPAQLWLRDTVGSLSRNPRVTLLTRTTAFGYFPHNLVGLSQRLTDHLAQPHPEAPRERQWQVRAREVVLATGAIERPLVFPGNDRPGIMLAGAARTWLNRYGAVPGTRAVVVTACDEAYRAALDLERAGVDIACVADVRESADGTWLRRALEAGMTVRPAVTVLGTGGRRRVNGVELARLDSGRVVDAGTQPCDLVLMSGGLTPSVHLHSQSRGKLVWDEGLQAFLPGEPAERTRSAGACRGLFGLDAAFADGAAAGAAAARDALAAGRTGVHAGAPVRSGPPAALAAAATGAAVQGFVGALPQPRRARSRAFVDWQNDVTTKDLALATREGFRSIEHVKRYTTTGMATDQGKTSNINALGIVSRTLGKSIPEVGLTTFRMPYTPVTFGGFAGVARGELFDPTR
ncbi:MAG TPA: 2Fe-2S iron-sulfur cluster-binding protein, partial [Steroidobacteraceae bacterium]|nr:2Fe-2S iron-sulfur cluster-binding protein [Steroidobacteraceae bacterium]